MKRLKRIICSVFVMIFAFSATCFAATERYTEQQLKTVTEYLEAANLNDKYVTAIINHISANPLNEKEAKTLTDEIDKFASKTEGKNSREDYTLDELTEMYTEAKTIASGFGLRLSMNGKIPSNVNQAAKTEITVYSANGDRVDTTTLKNIKEIKSKIDLENLKSAVRSAVLKKSSSTGKDPNQSGTATGTQDTNKSDGNGSGIGGSSKNGANLIAGNRNPIMSTSMKKTGTNNGNLLLAGSVLVVSALGIVVYSRKRKMA